MEPGSIVDTVTRLGDWMKWCIIPARVEEYFCPATYLDQFWRQCNLTYFFKFYFISQNVSVCLNSFSNRVDSH